MENRGKWAPQSMPYDAASRKNFKPAVKQYDVAEVLDKVGTYKKGRNSQPIPDVTEENDIYDILGQLLGYPYSARLRRILEWLLTPLEAEVGDRFGSLEEV